MSPVATRAAVRSRMTHRCTIERDGAGSDAEGNPATPAWATHLSAQPCFYWSASEVEAVDVTRTAVVEDGRLLLPKGTDVTERDRVNGITDRLGNAVRSGVLNIRAVVSYGTHLELVVQGVAR